MDLKIHISKLKRPFSSYRKVQIVIGYLLRNRRSFFGKKEISGKEYLNLGCGQRIEKKLINLDYDWRPGVDICWDLKNGIPLNSESIKGVFTEHCLEHVSFDVADRVIGEIWRVLKPGGIVRIVVPDGELYLRTYLRKIIGDQEVSFPFSTQDQYQNVYSPIMSVNRIFRAHGHQYIFDFDCLNHLLTKWRFVAIKREAYLSGRLPALLLDTESRAVESLYVEAQKPL